MEFRRVLIRSNQYQLFRSAILRALLRHLTNSALSSNSFEVIGVVFDCLTFKAGGCVDFEDIRYSLARHDYIDCTKIKSCLFKTLDRNFSNLIRQGETVAGIDESS